MAHIKELLENNRKWSEELRKKDADFFSCLSKQQNPKYLWIGCSDSRVPANTLINLAPGEVFVHRNVANVIVHSDLNALSVLQYAVDVLQVEEILVVGHYGCGGVSAALRNDKLGLIDNWLCHVQDVMNIYEEKLSEISNEKQRINCLCELNVLHQVKNISNTTILESAWKRGQFVMIHGWCYSLSDGILKDLNISSASDVEFKAKFTQAVKACLHRYLA